MPPFFKHPYRHLQNLINALGVYCRIYHSGSNRTLFKQANILNKNLRLTRFHWLDPRSSWDTLKKWATDNLNPCMSVVVKKEKVKSVAGGPEARGWEVLGKMVHCSWKFLSFALRECLAIAILVSKILPKWSV